MARFDWAHVNFTAGEITPNLYGRLDFDRLFDGCTTLENFLVLPHGGVTRRPGTCYVASALSDDNYTRLIGFQFSTIQAYMLEFGQETMRWYRNAGTLSVIFTDAVITNGTFDANITGWTDNSNGTGAISWDSGFAAMKLLGAGGGNEAIAEQSVAQTADDAHVLTFRVRTTSRDDTVELKIGSSSGGAEILAAINRGPGWHSVEFDPGTNDPFYVQFENELDRAVYVDDVKLLTNEPHAIGTPYTYADLKPLHKVQSADIMWVTSPEYKPYELRRLGNTTWSFLEYDFEDGPYLDTNVSATTLTPSATSGVVTLTASSIVGINGGVGFKSTDVGRLVRMEQSSTWSWLEITAFTSTTVVSALVRGATLAASAAVTAWRLGAWSDTTGWPAVIAFHEERLTFARTYDNPQTIWFSRSNAFNQHDPTAADGTVVASDGITVTIASDTVNATEWLASAPVGLMVGTNSNEVLISAPNDLALSPTDIEARPQTNRGSEANVPIARIGHSVLYVQRAGQTVREILFSFEADGLVTRDLGLLSEHMLRLGITDLAYQQLPFSILWSVRKDGQLLAMTFERDHKVFAWSRNKIGGTLGTSWPQVDTIAVIPAGDYDELWMIAKRETGGLIKRHVMWLDKPFRKGQSLQDTCLTDDTVSISGSEIGVVDDLPFNCETVDIIADGELVEQLAVFDNAVTLKSDASNINVGVPFTAILEPLPFDSGIEGQTTRGKLRRIHQVHVYFDTTLGGRLGFKDEGLEAILYRKVTDPMDSLPPIFCGVKTMPVPQRVSRAPQFRIETSESLPMTVNSIIMDAEVQGS